VDFELRYVRVFVRDFERALRFYSETLGLEVAYRSDELGWAELATGSARLALERARPEADDRVGRFVGVSLAVDDLTATYERLRGRGASFAAPPERMPWGGSLAELRDPDGNVLTLLERRRGEAAGKARLVEAPAVVEAAGNLPKRIEEFIGRVRSGTEALSVARMKSPPGWQEPGQTPEFDEYTLVLAGSLRVETRGETFDVRAGQAVHAPAGGWVRYGTPGPEGAEYVAVCVPAFSPAIVHRDP
jgi:predicted enzyme related to lactoylglutathione lyase/quercetin dioxygenase-like cupin family protein